jgi:hypothetical protein
VLNFTSDDAIAELGVLRPPSLSFNRAGSLFTGDDFVVSVRDTLHRVLHSNKDGFFHLFGLLVKESIRVASDASSTLAKLTTALEDIRRSNVYVDTDSVYRLIDGLDVLVGQPSATQTALIGEYLSSTRSLLNSSRTSTGEKRFSRSTHGAAESIFDLVTLLYDHLRQLGKIQTSLNAGYDQFKFAESSVYSVDRQALLIRDRLAELSSSGNENDAVLTAVVGYSLLSERQKSIDPRTAKYTGAFTVGPGNPASLTSLWSLPINTPTLESIGFSVDGDSGFVEIPSSAVSARIDVDLSHIDWSGFGAGRLTESPRVASTSFGVVVNNTIVSGMFSAGTYATAAAVASELDSILSSVDPNVNVSNPSGSVVRFIYTNVSGSCTRFGLLGTDLDFQHTYAHAPPIVAIIPGYLTRSYVKDVYGSDTKLSDVYTSGFLTPPLLSTETYVLLSGSDNVHSSDPTRVDVDTTDLQPGDSIVVSSPIPAVYRVSSVNAGWVTTASEILMEITGSTLSASSNIVFSVVRSNLVVSSPSSEFGITDVTWSGNTFMGFSGSDQGTFTSLSLDDEITAGTTLRFGDSVFGLNGNVIGTIARVNGSTITLNVVSQSNMSSNDVSIFSMGEVSYRAILPAMRDVTESFFSLVKQEDFEDVIFSYVASTVGKGSVDSSLLGVSNLLNLLISEYSLFQFNSLRSITQLIGALGEEKLGIFRERLLGLKFVSLFEDDNTSESIIGSLTETLNSVISELGSSKEIVSFVPGNSIVTDYSEHPGRGLLDG